MKYHLSRWALLYLISLSFSLCSFTTSAETRQKEVFNKDTQKPIYIESNNWEWDYQKNIIAFTGDVELRKDDLKINCREMFVYINNQSGNKSLENIDSGIEKILALENVKIRQQDFEAMAKKAEYYQNDEKIIFSGDPAKIKWEDSSSDCMLVTVMFKENRIENIKCDGSENTKTKTVFYPKDERSNPIGPK